MAAVEITISGVLYDKYNRTQQNVVLIGEATITGLQVGGGPMPPGQGGGEQPPGIWGPPGPWPTPPIHLPPAGGGQPPGIWGPPGPWPTPPIQMPPDKPPEPIQPPVEWKAVWHPTDGWIVVGVIKPEAPHPTPSAAGAATPASGGRRGS